MATLDQFRGMLRINKLRLDDELEIQAEIQEQIGREVARLSAQVQEAKDALIGAEGEFMDRAKERDPKATVDQLKGRMVDDARRRAAWERLSTLRLGHDEWDALLQAWITKGYKLADLGALYSSDYFAVRTVSRPDGERRRELDQREEQSREAIQRGQERQQRRDDPRAGRGAAEEPAAPEKARRRVL